MSMDLARPGLFSIMNTKLQHLRMYMNYASKTNEPVMPVSPEWIHLGSEHMKRTVTSARLKKGSVKVR